MAVGNLADAIQEPVRQFVEFLKRSPRPVDHQVRRFA
jgi:hypothetical protein